MPIFYNRVQRKTNPSDKNSETKWFPVAKTIKQATGKEIARYISRETTLNPKEAEMAIAMMAEATEFYLKHGYTVSLGDWASFNLTLTAEGVDEESKCTGECVKKVVPHCRFAKAFKARMQLENEFQLGTSLQKKPKKDNSDGDGGIEPGGDVTE